MSKTRARTTPCSPVEITEPKRRVIDPEERKIYEWNDGLFKDVPPPPPQSPIAYLFHHRTIEFLAKEVEKTPQLVQRAKEILAIVFSEEEEEEEGVVKFSNVVCETWPLLDSAIKRARYLCVGNVVGLVKRYSNYDSATQRWAHMKADPSLGSTATTENDILRLFLSVLIGYWGDDAELPKLDKAFCIPRSETPKIDVKRYTYKIKGADEAKDMEHVRKWLVTQYGHNKNVDVDDLFEDIKSELLSHLKIGEECGHFYGSKALFADIRVMNSWSVIAIIQSC